MEEQNYKKEDYIKKEKLGESAFCRTYKKIINFML